MQRGLLFTLFALSWLLVGAAGAWVLLPPREGPTVYVESPPLPYRFYELGALAVPYFESEQVGDPDCPEPSLVYVFTSDTCPDLYGVDLSHHDQDFDFATFAASGVDFAHIRATHGETIVDGQLRRHGEGLVKAGIPFGTYHFFSSLSDPAAQARNYLDAIAFLEPHAMLPPVLDMEWDISAADPDSGDRWANWAPREIADAMDIWLTIVERETGVRPMIYTNTSWWQARLGAEGDRFQAYPLWISRYGQFDRHLPDVPVGFDVAFWQFSEDASVPGISETFNASRLNGDFVRRALAE